jgi:hypothetical protein
VGYYPTVSITTADSMALDPFSRLRTADPGYRFDGQLTYGIGSDSWDSLATGSGSAISHSATERWAVLSAAAVNPASCVLQSHYHAPYTPGRGQLALITGLFGSTPSAGCYRRMGYYDGTNGVYLEQTAAAVNLVKLSSTTAGNTTVAQASWNLDPFDGTGPSGITLDLTKIQILVIDLQALYAGRIRVGFDIDGVIWPAHEFLHSNAIAYPYIAQANLPVRWECGGTGSAVTMYGLCASVISEGGVDLDAIPGRTWSVNNGATAVAITTRAVVLAIRPNAQVNSINQNGLILPTSFGLHVATNDAMIELVRNPTYGGSPTWTDVDATNSLAEFAVNATTITGGTTVYSDYALSSGTQRAAPAGASVLGRLVLAYSHLLSAADSLAIVATSQTGTSNIKASMNWKEIR